MDSHSTIRNPSSEGAPTIKVSKFKPSMPASSKLDSTRRANGLSAFSTPGFQGVKQYSGHSAVKQDVISISSDSAPSTPGKNSIKRHSSGFSIPDELSPPVKRMKKMPDEWKENIFQNSSGTNVNSSTEPSRVHRIDTLSSFSDLNPQLSLQTLMQYQIYALDLSKHFSQEGLAYHSGTDMKKDICLIESIKKVIDNRLEVIDGLIKVHSRNRIDPLAGPIVTASSPIKHPEEPKALYRDTTIVVDNAVHQASCSSYTKEAVTDVDYWEGIEEIPMDFEPNEIASCLTTQTIREDSALTSTPFYAEVRSQLTNVFKLANFRHNQLGAITATLEGRDVFVLMPTGGGKSLCYQLPAVCTTGKTKGVTVVVSPLLALMKDQVKSLLGKNINALLSTSETGGDDWNRLIVNKSKPSMWYLTPEKLRDSGKVNDILARLYKDGSLARFVIDEAHCISTWGQDFRDAYTSLGSLRDKYPNVPIMALTATANKRTVCDIIAQLRLRRDHVSFTQSFNRTNLSYMVRTKRGSPLNEIVNFVNTKHQGHAGVVYCLARQTCENVARGLREKNISAGHFHAGMSAADKEQTADDWQTGKVLIIVATIAFGMGIDKSNVRFVIHYDMPKTLSGYYQETGRAGRDGQHADCLMFYSGHDLFKLRNQIQKSDDITEESKRRQEAAVKEVYEFCKKISVCRRVQLLRHFDEDFDSELCQMGCDTCQDDRETVSRDVTNYVRGALALAKAVHKDRITFVQFGNVLRGSKASEILTKGFDKHPQHGSCSDLPKELCDLMLDELLYLGLLAKATTQNASGFHTEYLALGEYYNEFLKSDQPVIIDWRPTPTGKGAPKQPRQRKAAPAYVVDVPPRSRKGKKKAVDEDPIEHYDDMYADNFDESHFDNIPELNTPEAINEQNNSPDPTVVPSSSTTTLPLPPVSMPLNTNSAVLLLYKDMVKLRDEIMLNNKFHSQEQVFTDEILQIMSICCPADYNDFTRSLTDAVKMDVPNPSEYAKSRWLSYGQEFLQLCIRHKTAMLEPSSAPAPQTVKAPLKKIDTAMYAYKSDPVGGTSSSGSASASTVQSSMKVKTKFKPAPTKKP